MKVSMMSFALAALAASAMSASAFAATSAGVNANANANAFDAQQAASWAPAQTALKSKTRAEVRQELVRAEKDGQLAALSKLYQGS
ncbi:MAG: hypothetical protein PCALPYG88_5897 [uncultured Paraburkholderia sp.]|uniref:DUF4148 domain-containing protein n=1 Tax=uncultured Paraburkholderia sp. TaxID=1822466 RepID=UPI002597989E|nr:DUF4148 domain-containing protein [uncultured Paraburkholderia sp.]CAH2902475.1 MAG: hypothetical protein PCALPYG08_6068 [uncultured Paraburkholderia sp.]CAH2937217.1 MAG: hypothetical protein PCALPYG88_5897 [uncultured Paraburkholderia sp.]